MKSLSEKSKLIATWVEVFGLLAAGLFAVVQYQAHLSEARAERAIGFLKRWSEEPLNTSQVQFSSAWNDVGVTKEWDALIEETRDDRDAMSPEGKLGKFVLKTIDDYKLKLSIYRINDFYATVYACADRELCDKALVAEFFCSDARSFAERTLVLTAVHRKSDPAYAVGLFKLLRMCRVRAN